ncbi:MAG: DUF1611 domain-containing protein [Chloroflexi bacterium]|nr:DUF1611 domain-containing protein [Chloroflexota bacterium]
MPSEPCVAILTEGLLTRVTAKTAIGVLRYAPYPVVAVIDSTRAGTDASTHVGVGSGVPVVATVAEAIERGANVVLVGTAAPGGKIPESYRPLLRDALERGLEVWNGLHERVLDHHDPRVRELREPPSDLEIGGHRARRAGARVILTVGSDAAVGKMTASLELVAALERGGARTAFVATGQTGIAIAGQGISVDAVVADFIAGAAERLVCDAAETSDWVIVEGQGSLTHPGFSGVTLGLLHGSAPDALVLCHDAARVTVKGHDDIPLRPLRDLVAIYESAATWSRADPRVRIPVVAVALNTAGLADAAAMRAIEAATRDISLPAADPVREGHGGADRLARAIRGALP